MKRQRDTARVFYPGILHNYYENYTTSFKLVPPVLLAEHTKDHASNAKTRERWSFYVNIKATKSCIYRTDGVK